MKKVLLFALMLVASVFASLASVQADTLYLQGSKGKLFTIIDKPDETANKLPLVIICHGFTSNCQEPLIATLAESIVSQGMATLRFDFNGHGKSEGEFKEMTVLNEIDDLKSVIDWARRQAWVKEIALVGHSQGGVVVSMVSGELGDRIIKAEVLMAAAAVLRDDALRGNTMGAMYNPWNMQQDYVELPHRPGAKTLQLGKAYIQCAMHLPVYETAENYRGPALIIQGTHDQVVPYTYAERYHEKIKKSELRLIPDENHGFSLTTKDTSLLVADWLHNHLLK